MIGVFGYRSLFSPTHFWEKLQKVEKQIVEVVAKDISVTFPAKTLSR